MRFVMTGCVALFAGLATVSSDVALAKECPGNKNALGVSRVVRIDTTGGPGFGFQHYKFYDFLKEGEVVLTFDDGPLPQRTLPILKALAKHCVRATFFPVGKLAVGYPEVLQQVEKDGHTIGSHTWSHANLAKGKKFEKHKDEIELGISATRLALGKPAAPFFRYPFLKDSPETIKHLAARNIGVFSTDIDSFDFRGGSAKRMINRVLGTLKKRGKGIVLFHDINPTTAKAMPAFLNRLKREGYKIVHLTAKNPVETIKKYDDEVAKSFKGRAEMASRPLSSVVTTVEE